MLRVTRRLTIIIAVTVIAAIGSWFCLYRGLFHSEFDLNIAQQSRRVGIGDIEIHGDFHLIVRKVARWRPHWLNPIANRQTYAIAWSPDGEKLAVAYEWGRKIEIIDPYGNDLATAEVPNGPNIGTSLAFVNGSSQILFEGQDTKQVKGTAFTLFDARSGQLLAQIPGPFHAEGFSVSPNGQLVAMRASDGNTIYTYRVRDWKTAGQIRIEAGVFALTFFADGQRAVVSSAPSQFEVIDVQSGAILKRFKIPGTGEDVPAPGIKTAFASALAISPDQKFLFAGAFSSFVPNEWENVVSRGAVQIFRLADGVRLTSFDEARPKIRKAEWDPRGRYVAFIDRSAHLFLWQPLSWRQSYAQVSLSSDAWSMAISPNGSLIAVSSEDGVTIYSVQ